MAKDSDQRQWENFNVFDAFPSEYLSKADIPVGQKVLTVIIEGCEVQNKENRHKNNVLEPILLVHLKGGLKPFICNKTNAKSITKFTNGSLDSKDWRGLAVNIYFDPSVTRGGEQTGGLRIMPTLPRIKDDRIKAIFLAIGAAASVAELTTMARKELTAFELSNKLVVECFQAKKSELDKKK